jgi:hypothetical protein
MQYMLFLFIYVLYFMVIQSRVDFVITKMKKNLHFINFFLHLYENQLDTDNDNFAKFQLSNREVAFRVFTRCE